MIKTVEAHGVGKAILNWIKTWLMDRKHRIGISGVRSAWNTASSGVPQGSVLGPLLFIFYSVNEVSRNISKFVGDT